MKLKEEHIEFALKFAVRGGSAPTLLRLERWRDKAAKKLRSEAAKCNILLSPLEGEKKFLGELYELRNFREGYKKYKILDRATECAMTDVGDKKGKIKMNKNNLQQKQPNNPVAFLETNHSPLTIHHSLKRKVAFTLAEVLITLGIIGVVVALILPTFIYDYKKNVAISKLKQTYTLLKNAEQFAIKEFGDVEDWDFSSNGIAYGETFAKKYYAPYLKTTDCQYNIKYGDNNTRIESSTGNLGLYSFWVQNAFCLPNGSMVYASNIGSNGRVSGKIIYVDVNGTSAPNIFGRDIFSFMVGNIKMKQIDNYYDMGCPAKLSTCSPQGFIIDTHKAWDADRDELVNACKNKGGNSGMNACAYLIESAGWEISKDYPVRF